MSYRTPRFSASLRDGASLLLRMACSIRSGQIFWFEPNVRELVDVGALLIPARHSPGFHAGCDFGFGHLLFLLEVFLY